MAVRNIYACSNSCVLGNPGGMSTNGGCHCLDAIRRTDYEKYRQVALGIQALRDTIIELEELLQDSYNEQAGEDL